MALTNDEQKRLERRIIESPAVSPGSMLEVINRFREVFKAGILDNFQSVYYALFGIARSREDNNVTTAQRSTIDIILGTGSPDPAFDVYRAASAGRVATLSKTADEIKAKIDELTGRARSEGAIGNTSIDNQSGVASSFDWLTTKGFIFAIGIITILIAIWLYREN